MPTLPLRCDPSAKRKTLADELIANFREAGNFLHGNVAAQAQEHFERGVSGAVKELKAEGLFTFRWLGFSTAKMLPISRQRMCMSRFFVCTLKKSPVVLKLPN